MFEQKIERREPGTGLPGRRAAERDSLFMMATIGKAGQSQDELKPLRVRNLSAIGLMADYLDLAAEGEAVVVTIRGLGLVPGKVAWVKRGQIGVNFDVEVDPKLARRPLNKQASSAWKRPD